MVGLVIESVCMDWGVYSVYSHVLCADLICNLDGHLYVLRNIGQYRTRALAHVAAAMSTLQSMSEDMEDLRERVAAPELVGDRIPVEVHMRSIKAGLDRLSEKRYQVKEREQATIKEILGSED